MTYPLLEQAPKDHKSEEFLQFLRDNNEVIAENSTWLVIRNCKYDKPEKRWYTAFLKAPLLPRGTPYAYLGSLTFLGFDHLTWLIKAPKDRSVKRFHVHMHE